MKPGLQMRVAVWLYSSLMVLLVVAVIALGYFAIQSQSALCTFRADLQGRYDDGVEFLVQHPSGIQGISAEDIQRSLANQRATLDALSDLSCR